jgi:transposase
VVHLGQQRVRRPSTASRFDTKYTQKTIKHPASVMVWACFSGARGRGSLYFLPKSKTMNSEVYLNVLEEKLLPVFEIHEATMFMHDNAPCHTAKKVSKFLKEKDVDVITWPGNSPDLNPIENAWKVMKSRVRRLATSNLEELKKEIVRVWIEEMSPEYFEKLSDSMPRRLEEVIKAKGQITKY